MKSVGRAATVALGVALMAGACSTTRYVGSAFSPEAARQIHRDERSGTIELLDPEAPRHMHLTDRVVKVTPDATVVRRPDGSDLTIRNDAIRRVRVYNRALGAGEGALVGSVVGAAAGALAGYGVQSQHPYVPVFASEGEAALEGGLLFGGLGAVLGALLGALTSHTTTYVFDGGH
jgi:hypothetical protein